MKLRAIIEQSGPVRLVIGGPPCEDLALVNADRTGGPIACIPGPMQWCIHATDVVAKYAQG